MDFDDVQSTDCMHQVSIQVADDIREHVRQIYLRMLDRSSELEDGMPNVVLPGLTLVWMECAYNIFGSASYESAVTLLRDIRPDSKDDRVGMKRAAADLMRRSGWTLKRRRA